MKKYLLILLAVFGLTCQARAQTCTASITTPIVFSSVNPLVSNTYDTTGTLTITCTGITLYVGACQDLGAGTGGLNGSNQRLLSNGSGGTIAFQMFQDAGYSTVWGSRHTAPNGTVPFLSRLGNGTITATIYLQLYATSPPYVPGTYSSTFSGADARLYYGGLLSLLLGCNASGLSATTQDTFTVTTTLGSLCLLNVTQNVNFGTATHLTSNIDTTGTLSVQCTSGTAYQISLGPGNGSGATTSSRKMTGPSATIGYALYRDSGRSQNWGNNAGVDTVGGTGTGSAVNATVYARIPPQSLPGVGTYNDTVIVTVTY
ncbi:MAG: spore coat protein U domain-containing protein [Rhodomicrobium sp.]